jgi:hypothetical protein
MRPLRIGAERTTHCDAVGRLVVAVLCRGDRVGRDTLLDPTLERAPRIEHVWAGSALAVIEAWREEQALEVRARVPRVACHRLRQPERARNSRSTRARRHDRIGEPVVLDELVTSGPEGGKVRAHGVDSRRTIRRQIPPWVPASGKRMLFCTVLRESWQTKLMIEPTARGGKHCSVGLDVGPGVQ